jgi:GrpB-like predicted nucleotidyltransferase (UPF0157 family)
VADFIEKSRSFQPVRILTAENASLRAAKRNQSPKSSAQSKYFNLKRLFSAVGPMADFKFFEPRLIFSPSTMTQGQLMTLTSKISPYDPQWPLLFTTEKRRIAEGFGAELIETHHVGSTAVPGLCAKPEIDILVVVSEHVNEAARGEFMHTLGYVRGTDLSTDHHFYRRDVDGVRTHKIHVCVAGHGQIARMLRFRDLLRESASIRQQYQDLKLRLEANNRGGIAEYLAYKAPYIDALMDTYLEE